MSRIAVVGSINQDIVIRVPRIPRPGETVHHGRLARYAGGKGANQAVAAARAGATVSMLGAVGTDADGDDLLRGLIAEGVDTTHVARVDSAATGTALIAVDDAGANSIAVAEGANFQIDPEDVQSAIAALQPVAVVGQREVPDDVINAAFQATTPGLRVLNVSPVDEGVAINLGLVDIAIVNEIEAAQLTADSSPDDDSAALARVLAEQTHRGCVVTLGGQGLVAQVDGQTHVQPAFPTTVVDTTGAGDAFCGVFTAALAAGRQVETALRWGQAAGALAAAKAGAQPSMPMADDIRRLAESELA
ncbi:MAG: ribokinase [Chloroflexota bacterium]|nr:ribokinase [Chloroflexota bacterium]MDE2899231.1 ribokinase [Chloroflexota bacterium]